MTCDTPLLSPLLILASISSLVLAPTMWMAKTKDSTLDKRHAYISYVTFVSLIEERYLEHSDLIGKVVLILLTESYSELDLQIKLPQPTKAIYP